MDWNRKLVMMTLLLGCALGAAPLSRITPKAGQFVDDKGVAFHPHGFNYIRLHNGWHDTFPPQRYDPQRADVMLGDLQQHGFNIVRVFIDHRATGAGIVESKDAQRLSPQYLANFTDFLTRAQSHRIYVIPSMLSLPECQRYRDLCGPADPRIGGGNAMYLQPSWINAKAQYGEDFATAIKAHNPALLSTIFAYELDNETHLNAAAAPFAQTSGNITGVNGQTYDLSSDQQKQRLADDHLTLWANASVAAIRQADPAAMVSINIFTFAAVNRSGPARFSSDKTRDQRLPARPLALADSKLSYIDIHFYPFNDQTLDRDLSSIEFDQLKVACQKRGIPLIMGEYGSFHKNHQTLPQAAQAMQHHLRRVTELGFVGDLYWTYDCDEQAELWNAKSAGGAIFTLLAGSSPR